MRHDKAIGRMASLVLLALLTARAALAEPLTLPLALQEIESEAFAGNSAISEVRLPAGASAVGERAFAGCSGLRRVYLPDSVTTIGADAFADCAEALLICTEPGSAAMTYASRNQLDYQANTTYRALLIGQMAYAESALDGPETDAAAMAQVLKTAPGTAYRVQMAHDLTGAALLPAIREAFAGAQPQDVSLLFYAGHGGYGGTLVGIDGEEVYPRALRACLDAIPGRKVVIVDACFSGALVGRGQRGEDDSAAAFVEAFMAALTQPIRQRALRGADYFVLTAAHSTQLSYETTISGKTFGVFTHGLCRGCGYDSLQGSACPLYADTNSDGVITLQEAYQYASTIASKYASAQTAQVWPTGCRWFGLLRY